MEHARQILELIAERVKMMPQERISDRMVQQCDEQLASLSGEEIVEVAQVAEQIVAVTVSLSLGAPACVYTIPVGSLSLRSQL